MITLSINIVETNDTTGLRDTVISNSILSVDSFNVSGGSTSKRIKMLPATVIKISDLIDIEDISGIIISSKSDDLNIYPLFDISVLDTLGDPQSTYRSCVFCIAGVQGLSSDLQIDNMENRGTNPEINILITIKE